MKVSDLSAKMISLLIALTKMNEILMETKIEDEITGNFYLVDAQKFEYQKKILDAEFEIFATHKFTDLEKSERKRVMDFIILNKKLTEPKENYVFHDGQDENRFNKKTA